jgi:hypothetical protein
VKDKKYKIKKKQDEKQVPLKFTRRQAFSKRKLRSFIYRERERGYKLNARVVLSRWWLLFFTPYFFML